MAIYCTALTEALKVDLECVSNIVNRFGPPGFVIRVFLFLFLNLNICFG